MSVPARFKLRVIQLDLIMDTLVRPPQIGAPLHVQIKYETDLHKKYEEISNLHTTIDPEYLTLEDVELLGNEWSHDSHDNLFGRFASLKRPVNAIVAGFTLSYKIGEELWLEYDGHSETGVAVLYRPDSPIMKDGHAIVYQRKTRRLGRRNRRNRSRNTRRSRSTRKN